MFWASLLIQFWLRKENKSQLSSTENIRMLKLLVGGYHGPDFVKTLSKKITTVSNDICSRVFIFSD